MQSDKLDNINTENRSETVGLANKSDRYESFPPPPPPLHPPRRLVGKDSAVTLFSLDLTYAGH